MNDAQDLPALSYLLTPPTPEDAAEYQAEINGRRALQARNPIGWRLGVGMDMLNWLCGMQELMAATIQQDEFVGELLEMITCWNIERMRLVLSAPVDLYIKRAWYEGCDFVTPGFYRRQILPRLTREVDLAHEHGRQF